MLGYVDQALVKSQEALAWAQELAQPYSLTQARYWTAQLQQFRRDGALALAEAEAAIALGTTNGFAQQQAQGTFIRGWALTTQGYDGEGFAEMQRGFTAWEATEAEVLRPYYLTLLAERCRERGDVATGLRLLDDALETAQRSGERNYEAEMYRLQGELLLSQEAPDFVKAEAALEQAHTLAHDQQAKSLELRAAMSLSRLWQQQDRGFEARILLADVYGWFTEGFDTADLKEARELLEKLP